MSFTRNSNAASTITFLGFFYAITIQRTHRNSASWIFIVKNERISTEFTRNLYYSCDVAEFRDFLKIKTEPQHTLANNSQSTHTHNYTYMVFLFQIWHSLNTFNGSNWPILATCLLNNNHFHCALSTFYCSLISLKLNLQVSRLNQIF